MTDPATEKQINFAKSLGIETPEQFSKQALKELIDKKLNPGVPVVKPEEWKDKPQPFSPVLQSRGSISSGEHHILINRVEKPQSFEFGKAGMRHKIYYSEIAELKLKIKELLDNGLVDPGDLPNLSSDEE